MPWGTRWHQHIPPTIMIRWPPPQIHTDYSWPSTPSLTVHPACWLLMTYWCHTPPGEGASYRLPILCAQHSHTISLCMQSSIFFTCPSHCHRCFQAPPHYQNRYLSRGPLVLSHLSLISPIPVLTHTKISLRLEHSPPHLQASVTRLMLLKKIPRSTHQGENLNPVSHLLSLSLEHAVSSQVSDFLAHNNVFDLHMPSFKTRVRLPCWLLWMWKYLGHRFSSCWTCLEPSTWWIIKSAGRFSSNLASWRQLHVLPLRKVLPGVLGKRAVHLTSGNIQQVK